MDKVKIQEIADEAGLSNGDLLEKAKELGFDVKAANSTINMENAGILVDYAISGTLPKGFKKPGSKAKIKVVKKKDEPVVEENAAEEVTETVAVEEIAEVVEEVTEEIVEEVVEEVAAPVAEETAETAEVATEKVSETEVATEVTTEQTPA